MAESSNTDITYPRASFMGLPVEIRQNIIRLVVQPEVEESNPEYRWLTEHLYELVMITYSDHKPPRLSPRYGKVFGHQLLRVSRTCYREAGPLVYEREGFYLFNDYDWGFWWRIQPLPYPPSFEMHHAKHPIPHAFAFIRELGFQPTAEMSANLVRAIEADFPSLITLRAFRHIYLREESDGELMGQLPDVWIEFHRYVLLAAVLVTKNHSKLKYAKWCDWRFLDKQSEDSIRTMTVKLTPDDTLSPNEDGLLDMERISKLPLTDADAWRDAVHNQQLHVEDFFTAVGPEVSSSSPEADTSKPRRIRGNTRLRRPPA